MNRSLSVHCHTYSILFIIAYLGLIVSASSYGQETQPTTNDLLEKTARQLQKTSYATAMSLNTSPKALHFKFKYRTTHHHTSGETWIHRGNILIKLNNHENHRTVTSMHLLTPTAWYHQWGNGTFKYRPYESPYPAFTEMLDRLQLQLATNPANITRQKLVSIDENELVIISPYHPSSLRRWNKLKAQFQQTKDAGGPWGKQEDRALALLTNANPNGVINRIDLKSGLIVSMEAWDESIQATELKWIAPEDAHELLTKAPTEVTDFSQRKIGPHHALAITYAWNQPDKRELQIVGGDEAGAYRVPVKKGRMIWGCFSRDYTTVYCSGKVPGISGWPLYKVNLQTGTSFRLHLKKDARYYIPMGVSPDNQQLALLIMTAQDYRKVLSPLYIYDLNNGSLKHIGNYNQLFNITWLPDGKGFMGHQTHANGESWITTIDMQGQITWLHEGIQASLFFDNNHYVYMTADRNWRINTLKDPNPRLFQQGLKGFQHGAINYDRTMLFFASPRKPKSPQWDLMKLDLKKHTLQRVNTGMSHLGIQH